MPAVGHETANVCRTTMRWGFIPILAGIAAAVVTSVTLAATPSYESVRANYTASERIIFDRNGAPIQHIRTDNKVRRSTWTPLDQMSPALIDAVLTSED